MSERKFNTYMKRHLLKENVGGDVENEFQNWLDEMSLKFDDEKITLQTVIDYAQDTLQDYGMDDWQPGQPLPENKKSVKENIETLLSPEDLEYYRAHRDEIEDILHAEWRSSKLSAKDAVEKHREGKLQQAKRGGGDETSLRAIAATLGNKSLKESRIKFDDFTLEVHEDFSSTPAIILPNIEFETDSEGYAIANNENSLKLRGFSDEIKAMYTLFGSESGVKDKNDLYISIDDIINYL